MYDYIIIDPASTEFNRGSFCYLPYILYSALTKSGAKVAIYENFTAADIDCLPKASRYLISIWSYPQIDTALVIDRFLEGNKSFFGYFPLIDHLKLDEFIFPDHMILSGIENYPLYYSDFNFILLSDCDMHLKKYSGQVYPLFTSYGCPNGCSFCPSTVNCEKRRIIIPLEKVEKIIYYCNGIGIHNIHFTDEDFFFNIDRAHSILKIFEKLDTDFQLISLGSAVKVRSYIKKYGENTLAASGMKLIEVGLETADSDLATSMHKPGHKSCTWLAENAKTPIFWLTMTFFPGETIHSLNLTGRFLKKYGYKQDELYGRIRTNSTVGGLGQFFQFYHGTPFYSDKDFLGMSLSDCPIRLLPSFVPYSFLGSKIESIGDASDAIDWFKLYNLHPEMIKLTKGNCIDEYVNKYKGYMRVADILTYLAICARLGVII